MAEDLGEEYEVMISTLQEAMGQAEREQWISCREYHKKGVYIGPDHRTRLDAAAKWMELSIGRKREEPKALPELPKDLEVGKWSDDELTAFLVSEYAADPEKRDCELEEVRELRRKVAEGGLEGAIGQDTLEKLSRLRDELAGLPLYSARPQGKA